MMSKRKPKYITWDEYRMKEFQKVKEKYEKEQ